MALWAVVLLRLSGGGISKAVVDADDLFVALSWIFEIAGAIAFFLWVSRSFKRARTLGLPPLKYGASAVIASFFLPIVNLFRPYQALRALDVAIEPASLPEPPPQAAAHDTAGGYRDPASAYRPPPRCPPPAPLLAWWLTWLSQSFLALGALAAQESWQDTAEIGLVLSVITAASAALGALVVLRIDVRLRERSRRSLAAAAKA
jgi:hypothetical protein